MISNKEIEINLADIRKEEFKKILKRARQLKKLRLKVTLLKTALQN